MAEKNKYEKTIQDTIDKIKENYGITYSLTNIKDPLHGGMPSYSGAIFIKGDNLNLRYNFEIIDDSFRFFNIGKIFGTGKEDKKGLETIAKLNKALAINLNLQLIEKKLDIDVIQEGINKTLK